MRGKKAIALLRVSSAAQAGPDRHGLSVQRAACGRIALTHGLEIVDWVELEGVSGAAVLSDPRFSALLSRLADPSVCAVVVAAFDRLFRRGRFSDYAILDAFAETGTRLFTADGELDLTGEAGGLLGVIRGELAGMERRRIIERTTAGRRRKRRQTGKKAEGPVGMPKGVQFDYVTGEWSYVWPQADQVRQVFHLFLSGIHNFREIHRRTGIGTKKDQTQAVRMVLTQPLYAGIFRIDKTWTKVDGKAIAQPLSPEDVVEHVVLDPSLVSREDFDEVQRLLAVRAASRPRRDPEAAPATYTRFLVCARCGGRMQLSVQTRNGKQYHSYVCWRRQTHSPGQPRCDLRQVAYSRADPALDEQLERILGDLETLEYLLEASTQEAARRASPSARDLDRQLRDLDARRRRVQEGWERGLYEAQEAEKRLAALADERIGIESMMGRDEEIEIPEDLVTELVEVFGSWRDLRRDEKRALLRDYRAEIVVDSIGGRRSGTYRVDRVKLGVLPPDVWLYKKTKQLGIEQATGSTTRVELRRVPDRFTCPCISVVPKSQLEIPIRNIAKASGVDRRRSSITCIRSAWLRDGRLLLARH